MRSVTDMPITSNPVCSTFALLQDARAAAQEATKRAEALRHEAEALREQFGAVETDAAERLERWELLKLNLGRPDVMHRGWGGMEQRGAVGHLQDMGRG
jgi:hypothetical protein